MDKLARGTPGLSGADLSNLINVAALAAAVRGASEVATADLEYAREKVGRAKQRSWLTIQVLMGPERKSAILTPEDLKITAYHEGGHALVALLTKGCACTGEAPLR